MNSNNIGISDTSKFIDKASDQGFSIDARILGREEMPHGTDFSRSSSAGFNMSPGIRMKAERSIARKVIPRNAIARDFQERTVCGQLLSRVRLSDSRYHILSNKEFAEQLDCLEFHNELQDY